MCCFESGERWIFLRWIELRFGVEIMFVRCIRLLSKLLIVCVVCFMFLFFIVLSLFWICISVGFLVGSFFIESVLINRCNLFGVGIFFVEVCG